MAGSVNEQNLVVVFYNPGRDSEFFCYSLPIPETAKGQVAVREFGGLTTAQIPEGGIEQPGWIYNTSHQYSQVEMKVLIGRARDPKVGSSPGIVGVFDRTNDIHLVEMIRACLEAQAYFEKNVMGR